MYITLNKTKYNVIQMTTFYKRLKGLMFKKDQINDIYIFPKCSAIHTYFMKQNIDICILDRNYNVTYIKGNIKPNKIIIKKGYYTLEMPLSTSKYLKIGDKLNIKK